MGRARKYQPASGAVQYTFQYDPCPLMLGMHVWAWQNQSSSSQLSSSSLYS